MTEETKRAHLERAPLTERETSSDELSDQVTNDSLGTTDIADSTGLDTDKLEHASSTKSRAKP